jgi:hypothetical protein
MTMSKGSTIYQAVANLVPNGKFCVRDELLEWLGDDEDKPSNSDVQAEVARLESEYDSLSYSRARADAYASLPDQADMQYWDAVNGTTVWKNHIAEVKAKHPKPE